MTIRFTKATRNNGVDGHFNDGDARVTVLSTELPAPIYPEAGAAFWSQFEAVIKEVAQAKKRSVIGLGVADCIEASGTKRADQAAALVHKDWPTDIITIAAKSVTSPWRQFTGISQSVFTDKVVLLNNLMAQAAWVVSANSFNAKWALMVPRPEEVAGAIVRGEITAPDQINLLLQDVFASGELESDQRKFTMYPEGSPNHPSYNAMHSAAASAAATIVKVMFDLSPYDRKEVDLTARNMAYFRTTAGVHYPQDNASGLWLGQETVSRWLPSILDELGVPSAEISAAISQAQTDWI